MDVEFGTFFTELDENTHSRVAVLGSDVKKKLFSGQNALGEKVRVDGISYEVIGVLKHAIQNGDDDMNSKIYIPFSAMSDIKNTYYLNAVVMEYEGDHEKVADGHPPVDGLSSRVRSQGQARQSSSSTSFADLLDLRIITTGIKILLGFIGLLTLGIGGVGLMNIMLVSVTQRTREIGVEKALGARSWHILVQFLAEALVITLLGGLAGVVLAYIVSWSVGSLTLWSAFIENAQRGRHSPDHRLHHADRIVPDSRICRHHQRHAARHQGLAARSHRSPALRIAPRPHLSHALSPKGPPHQSAQVLMLFNIPEISSQ